MTCPRCNQPMVEDGEWPFTDQKTNMTFQTQRFTCTPCRIYTMEEING